jgi:hypothetical protein
VNDLKPGPSVYGLHSVPLNGTASGIVNLGSTLTSVPLRITD